MATREDAPGPADPDAFAALEEERDFLLGSLDDLEREYEAGDVDAADYEALRDDYTARAAAVLRSLDAGEARFATAARPRDWRRLAATVVVVLLIGGVAGVLLARASGTRGEGDTITGDIRLSIRDELVRAQGLLGQGQALEAIQIFDEVLAEQPDNVEALTYRGWALGLAELNEEAMTYLDRAVALDPDYVDARVFRAIILDRGGDPQAAAAELAQVDPATVPRDMESLVAAFRERLTTGTQAEG